MRFILTNPDWGHIFDDGGDEISTRWIYDTQEEKIIRALIDDANDGKWRHATKDEISHLEDSIKDANADCLDNPKDWGLSQCDDIPLQFEKSEQATAMKM